MIVMDTHIWLWWVNENIDLLGQVRNNLIQSEDIVAVSAISCFEVAWLDAHNRIQLSCNRTDWFEKALEGSDINLLPITPAIASLAVDCRNTIAILKTGSSSPPPFSITQD